MLSWFKASKQRDPDECREQDYRCSESTCVYLMKRENPELHIKGQASPAGSSVLSGSQPSPPAWGPL